MRYILFYTGFLLLSCSIQAQFDHISVHSGVEGDELLSLLVDDFKPNGVLNYGEARDSLYRHVYMRNDTVKCMYTGYAKYLDPQADPTDFLYDNDGTNGINAEHLYPQSKGAGDGNARADMHHLYPCRAFVNTARSADPFAEIPDDQTERWFYLSTETNNIPQNKDLYSEDTNDRFEPREEIKGDVARAMMYFFTMYESAAINADPDFFELQRELLCTWHHEDPVDEEEWNRTMKIASLQDNKPNPFILDCTLAGRSYCDEISVQCKLVNTEPVESGFDLSKIQNPGYGTLQIEFQRDSRRLIQVFDTKGNRLFASNEFSSIINIPWDREGVFIVRVVGENQQSKTYRWINLP